MEQVLLHNPMIKQEHQLHTKRILFGHMSVGRDILDGVQELEKTNKNPLLVKPIQSITYVDTTAGLYEFMLGNNGSAEKKIHAFKEMVSILSEKKPFDVICMKLCYIDVIAQTDKEQLLSYYDEIVKNLSNTYPQTKILHCTVPLTVHGLTIKEKIKNLIRGDQNNIARNEYNTMLKNKYGIQSCFDIATHESTSDNSHHVGFKYRSTLYQSLSPLYSTDGGHLNIEGKTSLARGFISSLNTLCTH